MILNSLFRLDFSQTTSCAITNFFGPSTTHNQKPAAAAAKTPLLSQKKFHLQNHQINTETHKYLICKIVLPLNLGSNLNCQIKYKQKRRRVKQESNQI
jgi:hypothetical protein